MPCRIYKLDFQEKNLNLNQDLNHARDLEIHGSNPGPGSIFSLENLICLFQCHFFNKYVFLI